MCHSRVASSAIRFRLARGFFYEDRRRKGNHFVPWQKFRHIKSRHRRPHLRLGRRHAQWALTRGWELSERPCGAAADRTRRAAHRRYVAVLVQGSLLAPRACDDGRDRSRGYGTLGH